MHQHKSVKPQAFYYGKRKENKMNREKKMIVMIGRRDLRAISRSRRRRRLVLKVCRTFHRAEEAYTRHFFLTPGITALRTSGLLALLALTVFCSREFPSPCSPSDCVERMVFLFIGSVLLLMVCIPCDNCCGYEEGGKKK